MSLPTFPDKLSWLEAIFYWIILWCLYLQNGKWQRLRFSEQYIGVSCTFVNYNGKYMAKPSALLLKSQLAVFWQNVCYAFPRYRNFGNWLHFSIWGIFFNPPLHPQPASYPSPPIVYFYHIPFRSNSHPQEYLLCFTKPCCDKSCCTNLQCFSHQPNLNFLVVSQNTEIFLNTSIALKNS